ncbi:hypothetical protein DFJ73DRAFT_807579 [Zopfochytrium polystomum]|nr:hypothetical protein DFJ73DRAFT_807579 [Zopfochytrium polystomum]
MNLHLFFFPSVLSYPLCNLTAVFLWIKVESMMVYTSHATLLLFCWHYLHSGTPLLSRLHTLSCIHNTSYIYPPILATPPRTASSALLLLTDLSPLFLVVYLASGFRFQFWPTTAHKIIVRLHFVTRLFAIHSIPSLLSQHWVRS